jgi:hypothetical protein
LVTPARAKRLELAFVLARHWPGLHLAAADFTTDEAVAAITRITR